MAGELKVVIDGDVSGAITAIERFENKLSGLATGSIAQLRAAADVLKTQLASLTPSDLKGNLGKALKETLVIVNSELKVLEKNAGIAGEKTKSVFNTAFQSLKNIANILPGVGLGTLIAFLIKPIAELISNLDKAGAAARRLDKELSAAVSTFDKKKLSVFALVSALQSDTLTTEQALKVKKELISIAPEFQKSFEGNKIKIDESNLALNDYVNKLINTAKVTAALEFVNKELAKSFETVLKGGTNLSFGQKLGSILPNILNPFNAIRDASKKAKENLNDALSDISPENISKLIQDTFSKLGISFSDFADTIRGDKIKDSLKDLTDDIIARARQFVKEFGDVFVVPDLSDSFLKSKDQILSASKKLLEDIEANKLKIKIPVETSFDLIPIPGGLSQEQVDRFIDQQKNEFQVTLPIDLSLQNTKLIDDMTAIKLAFIELGKRGREAISKIDFTNISSGIEQAQGVLSKFKSEIDIFKQIGSVITGAFDSLIDSILEGKASFQDFFKNIISGLTKVIAKIVATKIALQLLNIIFPGIGVGGAGILGIGGQSSGLLSLGQQIGSRSFQNSLVVNVTGSISNDVIRLSGQRATSSEGRFG
jgi:hypothetical protein